MIFVEVSVAVATADLCVVCKHPETRRDLRNFAAKIKDAHKYLSNIYMYELPLSTEACEGTPWKISTGP